MLLVGGGFTAFMFYVTQDSVVASPNYGIMLGAGIVIYVATIIGSIFFFQKKLFSGGAKLKERLMREGIRTKATVLSVQDTGVTINEIYPVVKIELAVKAGDRLPFNATVETMISRVSIPRQGDVVEVLYNPANHAEIVIA